MSLFNHRCVRGGVVIICLILLGAFGIRRAYYYHPIPKVIHWVWVGPNPIPESVNNVLASWKKYAPDYRINKIDETTCDVNANNFVKQAYAAKSYNFVSDYCRMFFLEKEGGLYLDVDHYLKASPNKMLRHAHRVFTMEDAGVLSGSFIAVLPHDPVIQAMVNYYNTHDFVWWPLPYSLTHHFNQVYKSIPVVGFAEFDNTRILPTNIAMLDFGGGEIQAEHLYDNLNAGAKYRGAYYGVYHNAFLKNVALPICLASGHQYRFILDTPETGYVFKSNLRAKVLSHTPKKELRLRWKHRNQLVSYEFKDGCYRVNPQSLTH